MKPEIQPLLDYDATAALLGITPRLARKLVEKREISSVKIGRLTRVEPGAVAEYIERRRRDAL